MEEFAYIVLFIITTTTLNELIRLVKEAHSYNIPEIIAMPIVGGNQDYLEWTGKEVEWNDGGD